MWPESSRIASGVSVGKGQVALGGGGGGRGWHAGTFAKV
jgi:hypothetical protein